LLAVAVAVAVAGLEMARHVQVPTVLHVLVVVAVAGAAVK
jgi:hypothetical protein